jgi:hypothetical protein
LGVIDRRVRRKLALATLRAAQVKVDLLFAGSEHVRNEAATEVLALAGVQVARDTAPLVNINNITPGYVVNLSGAPVIDGTAHDAEDAA